MQTQGFDIAWEIGLGRPEPAFFRGNDWMRLRHGWTFWLRHKTFWLPGCPQHGEPVLVIIIYWDFAVIFLLQRKIAGPLHAYVYRKSRSHIKESSVWERGHGGRGRDNEVDSFSPGKVNASFKPFIGKCQSSIFCLAHLCTLSTWRR